LHRPPRCRRRPPSCTGCIQLTNKMLVASKQGIAHHFRQVSWLPIRLFMQKEFITTPESPTLIHDRNKTPHPWHGGEHGCGRSPEPHYYLHSPNQHGHSESPGVTNEHTTANNKHDLVLSPDRNTTSSKPPPDPPISTVTREWYRYVQPCYHVHSSTRALS
jgi:hypothetical protein